MKSKEFIVKELNNISSTIEGVGIRYEYDKIRLIHLIEIKPLDLFENNLSYIEKEIEINNKFDELFPNEEVVFISENSLNKIKEPDLIIPIKLKTIAKKTIKFNTSFSLNGYKSTNNNLILAA